MLSERLLTISNMIIRNKVVFDVGSDHALLPCFLMLNNISKKVYAGDIADGPLSRARETIKKYHLEDKVIAVKSDGLKNASDDVEVVTVSGMGFYTIKEILENADLNRYEQIICAPNKEMHLLRKYISDHNYTILDEKIVRDGFYYEIVSFNTTYHNSYNLDEINYGPINLKRKEDVFKEYLGYQIEKLENINRSANKTEYKEKVDDLKRIYALI